MICPADKKCWGKGVTEIKEWPTNGYSSLRHIPGEGVHPQGQDIEVQTQYPPFLGY